MSSRSVGKLDEDCGKSREYLKSSKNAWMSRWMRPSHSEAAQSNCSEDLEHVRNQSGGPKPIRSFTMGESKSCEMTNAKPVGSFNMVESKSCEVGNPAVRETTGSLENEVMSSSLFKNNHNIGETHVLKAALYDRNLVDRGKAIESSTGIHLRSEGFRSLDKDSSQNLPQLAKAQSAADGIFTTSTSVQELHTKAPSHIVPYNFDLEKHNLSKGKAVVSSFDGKTSFKTKQDMTLLEHDHCHEQSKPAGILLQERNINFHKFTGSENVCYTGTGSQYLSTFGRNSLSNMLNSSGIRMFPSECVASEEIQRKMSYNISHSQQKLQDCDRDAETMRLSTTLGSVEGIQGVGGPMFSQMTHKLLITKNVDVNLSNDNDVFRSTRVITKFDGNQSKNVVRLSTFFGQGVMGVKIIPMNNCSDTERNQFGDVKASKVTIRNESSAETDTMDLDSLKEMHSHSGEHSTKPTKMENIKRSLPPGTGIIPSTEAKSKQPKIQIPDINLKLPLLPATDDPQDNMCASSSRTKSFGMDKLAMSSFIPIYSDIADPGNRWVKRLKVSSSDSYVQAGRNYSGLSENLHHENMGKLFLAKILKTGITSGQLSSTKQHHGEESILPDRSGSSLKKDKELVVKVDNKDTEILLSHPWVKRWLRNNESAAKEKKPETAPVLCEPDTSKLVIEDVQKEQFPSIAAMALMGKAMNGFQPCQLQKKGSFTIWNTKAF